MNRSLWFTAARRVELREEPIPTPGRGELLVKTTCSAISAGTEMLIYRGEAPVELSADSSINSLTSTLEFPLKYGYACVGEVASTGGEVAESWVGKRVFAFNPHEEWFVISAENALEIPAIIPDSIAALLPNMETAVSLVMDGQPVIGENVTVLGLGIVGQLVTRLLSDFPLATLTPIDQNPFREELAHPFTIQNSSWSAQYSADLIYELTGNPAALNDALDQATYSTRIVVGSWYGNKTAPLNLGGNFHRNHVQLVSSQVSTLSPRWRGRWTKQRRLKVALSLLQKYDLTHLITHRLPFANAAEAYRRLDGQPEETLQIMLTYS